MDPEITPPQLPLLAGAVAIGAVCAMVATIILFPIIDRLVRERFKLERGGAMLLLLALSLLVGLLTGAVGFFWLKEREVEGHHEAPLASIQQVNFNPVKTISFPSGQS